ncbi:MAG: AAA family ATPase [Clostridiales bacterium]|nr:AAA family ATPase [Clostridiales bacterium]
MEILKASIEGFRNIDQANIEFLGITALVSLNSYGKSNLLKAIDFAVDFINLDSDAKKRMMSWSSAIPLNRTIVSKDFLADFEFKVTKGDREYYINYGFTFSWVRDDDKGARINKEWLKIKSGEKGQKYKSYILRDKSGAYYKTSQTGRCNNSIKIEKDELVINKLKAYDSLYYIDLVMEINNISVYIERHLDASVSYSPDPLVRKDFEDLDVSGVTNIPRTVFHLKRDYPEKYQLLENAFMQLFPQITEISVDEVSVKSKTKTKFPQEVPYIMTDSIYVITVVDKNLNQPINFERLSDGAKKVFLMLTYALLADIKGLSLIAFEEPENSIHPSLLQSYLIVLNQLVNRCRIVIASHSPYILKYLDPSNIYVGIPNEGGLARFVRVQKSKVKSLLSDADAFDKSTGDYLFDLLGGSKDDIEQLKIYLEN